MSQYPFLIKSVLRLFFAFLIVAALILAKQILIPFFLSIMAAYLLYPFASWMEKKKIPRIAANLIAILCAIAVLAAIIFTIIKLSSNLTDNLPDIQEKVQDNLESIKASASSFTGMPESRIESIGSYLGETGKYLSDLLLATVNTILYIVLLPVYTFLFLFYRNKFKEFLFMKVDSEHKKAASTIIEQAATIVPKYLKGLIIVCGILVLVNTLGFTIIGVEYALLMGIIAALFNLIPYLGTILGYGVVFLFVYGTQSSTIALYVAIQFFIVQFLENNILTPNITGSYVSINPFVTIFSLIAVSTIWGLPGMLIIIPYIGMFKIICENVEQLKPTSFLLGTTGTERYTITLKKVKKFFGVNGG